MGRLKLNGVYKSFDGDNVVTDFNLSIEQGEFIALLGPSGCGKSTILRMLAGFEKVSAGSISYGDRCFSSINYHLPTEDRNFGMVFQSYALWPHLTVKENVGYPLKVQKINSLERDKRVFSALENVQLQDYTNRSPNQLSGGQRQRVALARSLVTVPDVVLFDEPLANLDLHLRGTMEETFRNFHQSTKATIIYVTHDQSEAMALADKIAVLNKGRIVQWGSPEELYTQPKSIWVANFIGKGSVLSVATVPPLQKINKEQLHALIAKKTIKKNKSSVLIRPQHIEFVNHDNNALLVTVYSSIFRGEKYDIELQLLDGQRLLAYSNIPLEIKSTHHVFLLHAWSLEDDV